MIEKTKIKQLVREALDESDLKSHLLEDIDEAFHGILKDLDTLKSFTNIDKPTIKRLQKAAKDVNLKLEKF